mmetsp:Transcript_83769/g.233640  ORF Transcript_83769/g.233640 Transcript_83769/m.233640 type:complete len:104 (+) Transcript_83769:927-1238(+)
MSADPVVYEPTADELEAAGPAGSPFGENMSDRAEPAAIEPIDVSRESSAVSLYVSERTPSSPRLQDMPEQELILLSKDPVLAALSSISLPMSQLEQSSKASSL